MLSEEQAIKIATDHLKKRDVKFRFHSAMYLPAESRPGHFKAMGNTWVVRFQRDLSPDVDETGLTMVEINSDTGRVLEMDPYTGRILEA